MFNFNERELYTFRTKDKIVSPEEARKLRNSWRLKDEKTVFTNGCFDIMHLGHITILENAYHLGDHLIVGVNSDSSVKRLKGESRPIFPENDRARMLASLEFVDLVVIFEEDTPENLIKILKPDILVKGEDYKDKEVVGREFVESYGGEVILLPLVKGYSTTEIIRRIKEA